MVALSVSTSAKTSPAATSRPSFTFHSDMLPCNAADQHHPNRLTGLNGSRTVSSLQTCSHALLLHSQSVAAARALTQ